MASTSTDSPSNPAGRCASKMLSTMTKVPARWIRWPLMRHRRYQSLKGGLAPGLPGEPRYGVSVAGLSGTIWFTPPELSHADLSIGP